MADFVMNMFELQDLLKKVGGMHEEIEKAADLLANTVAYGGTIYVMGNGGSAADANHFSGEILGRFKKERKGLAAVSLAADNATITAIANDYGYQHIFSRQLEGLYDPLKDIVFTMTTSGNSVNILEALDYVGRNNGKAVNLLGKDGGHIGKNPADNEINIIIPAQDSDRIQEMHKFILHYFAEVIEERYIELKGSK